MNNVLHNLMRQATRLTQAGRLNEATAAILVPKRLRRYGIEVAPGDDPLVSVLRMVDGMAAAYARTFNGAMAVYGARYQLMKRAR